MLSQTEIDFFDTNGYLVIPGVLDQQTVSGLRSRILSIFESEEWKKSAFNSSQILAKVFDDFPEFIETILNERVIHALEQLLGTTPVLLPETAIHHRFYTGWHKDTTSQEKAGLDFHKKPGAKLLQCGYYLQDNDLHGGGLTVMKGSHLTSDHFQQPLPEWGTVKKIKRKLGLYNEEKDSSVNPHKHEIVDIRSKAGDFVIFNMCTSHRATLPDNGRIGDVPSEKSKIAIFNAFAADNFSAEAYYNYIISRKEAFYQSLADTTRSARLLEHAEKLKFIVK